MDANERIRDIMIVADGLISLLIKENDFLKNREYDDIKKLVEQKNHPRKMHRNTIQNL